MPEFFEESPLSKAGKYPDFQVTSCYILSPQIPNFTIDGITKPQILGKK
jgi:hypothetical protein